MLKMMSFMCLSVLYSSSSHVFGEGMFVWKVLDTAAEQIKSTIFRNSHLNPKEKMSQYMARNS